MSDAPARRGLFAVCIVGLVALVCLLLGHNWLEGYLEEQREKRPAAAPVLAAGGGVSGRVAFADGSPASAVRVTIRWTDSAGRPGATPSLTDAAGRFQQGNIPVNSTVTEVTATLGPLVGRAGSGALPPGAARAGLVVALPAEFRLAGMVKCAGDRSAVAGATLEVAAARATSGADGGFDLAHVPASALREARPVVRVVAPGFKPLDWPLPKDGLPETYGDVTIALERVP